MTPIDATIMIIDDEPENLNLLGDMLRGEGWHVRAFRDGALALAAAVEEPPDVVLLDIRMPGLDGYEVCRRFKGRSDLQAIPIVFLSAFTDSADKVRAFEAGGSDYVTKPFAEVEVLARTALHLRLARHQHKLEDLVRQRVAELAEAHRRLRIWDDAKTQWLETLSHEVRTPLQGVFGIAELLFRSLPMTAGNAALVEAYDRARDRMVKLVDDASLLTAIDVGAETFETSPVLVAPLLNEVVGTIHRNPIEVSTEALDGVAVLCAARLLDRALAGLLLTATRCSPEEERITVDAAVVDSQVRIAIATRGKPLPREAIETFFDVGGQRALLKGGGDFGLAPALACRIVQLFNGRVAVRNGESRGIVMEVLLPLVPAADAAR